MNPIEETRIPVEEQLQQAMPPFMQNQSLYLIHSQEFPLLVQPEDIFKKLRHQNEPEDKSKPPCLKAISDRTPETGGTLHCVAVQKQMFRYCICKQSVRKNE